MPLWQNDCKTDKTISISILRQSRKGSFMFQSQLFFVKEKNVNCLQFKVTSVDGTGTTKWFQGRNFCRSCTKRRAEAEILSLEHWRISPRASIHLLAHSKWLLVWNWMSDKVLNGTQLHVWNERGCLSSFLSANFNSVWVVWLFEKVSQKEHPRQAPCGSSNQGYGLKNIDKIGLPICSTGPNQISVHLCQSTFGS